MKGTLKSIKAILDEHPFSDASHKAHIHCTYTNVEKPSLGLGHSQLSRPTFKRLKLAYSNKSAPLLSRQLALKMTAKRRKSALMTMTEVVTLRISYDEEGNGSLWFVNVRMSSLNKLLPNSGLPSKAEASIKTTFWQGKLARPVTHTSYGRAGRVCRVYND